MISDPKRVNTATDRAAESHPSTAGAMIGALLTTDIREDVAAIHSPVLLVGAAMALVANFTAFIVALAILQHVWLLRILRRRFEAEQREDPERARVRRGRERRAAILGWSLGLTFGTLGLILGMLMT